MSKYSNYGLDETKRSNDSGSMGSNYCPWCSSNSISIGMSLCFSNWVICHDCSKIGRSAFEEHTPETPIDRIQLDKCFKKNNKASELCYMSLGDGFNIGISLEYILLAEKLLREKKAISKNGQFRINFE